MVVLSKQTQVGHANIIYTIETFSNAIFQVANLDIDRDLNEYTVEDIVTGVFSATGDVDEVSSNVQGSFTLRHCGTL